MTTSVFIAHGAGNFPPNGPCPGRKRRSRRRGPQTTRDEKDMPERGPAVSSGSSRRRGGRCSCPVLGGLERQRQAKCHRGDQLIQRIWTAVTGRASSPREKRDDDRCRLSRIRRQGPYDHLLDVVVDGAPSRTSSRDRSKIVIRKYELGRFLPLGRSLALSPWRSGIRHASARARRSRRLRSWQPSGPVTAMP